MSSQQSNDTKAEPESTDRSYTLLHQTDPTERQRSKKMTLKFRAKGEKGDRRPGVALRPKGKGDDDDEEGRKGFGGEFGGGISGGGIAAC